MGLLAASQLGCTVPASGPSDIVPFPGGPSAAKSTAGYTLETPIEIIAADPRGAAVLNRDIPGLLANGNYGIFKGMGLRSLASLASGRLSDQVLARTEADLAALSN